MPARAAAISDPSRESSSADPQTDWRRVASLLQASRALDDIEETRLVPERKVLYQFSARGHDFAQILLGLQLTDAHDGISLYYRSRPLVLALGVSLEEAAAGPLARSGAFSGGRDIGVVFNLPGRGGPTVLPAVGGVGAQYTPAAGWAQAIRYRHETLGDAAYARSIAVVLGGDASTATNGFWSALNIATTQSLPMLFYIEDNGFGISVPAPGSSYSRVMVAIRRQRPSSRIGQLLRCARREPRCCCASPCHGSRVTPARIPRPTSRGRRSRQSVRATRSPGSRRSSSPR